MGRMPARNASILAHAFLEDMFRDGDFPDHLVEKGKLILLDLCARIEREQPEGEALYALTHEATERFNALAEEFYEHDSEIETVARDNIGSDVDFILRTYGYDLDIEEAIAPRDW
jgi:hypothetical protein